MWQVWRYMAQAYGSRWSQQYGERPSRTWTVAVERMARADVIAGIERLTSEPGHEWPPTLPEFTALCRPHVDRTDGAAIAARMPASRGLPVPPAELERRRVVAQRHLAEAREILNCGRRSETA